MLPHSFGQHFADVQRAHLQRRTLWRSFDVGHDALGRAERNIDRLGKPSRLRLSSQALLVHRVVVRGDGAQRLQQRVDLDACRGKWICNVTGQGKREAHPGFGRDCRCKLSAERIKRHGDVLIGDHPAHRLGKGPEATT